MLPGYDTVVWDLGGVLIDWDPRYLYRRLLPNDAAVDAFLVEVGFFAWNAEQDAGRPFAEGLAAHGARFPHRRALLAAYRDRFRETLGGEFPDAVELLRDVRRAGVRSLALTNWSSETFEHARASFGWLADLDGVLVSGDERVAKPDRRIFQVLLRRYAVDPGRAVYTDDNPANVEAARSVGLDALCWHSAAEFRAELEHRGVLRPAA